MHSAQCRNLRNVEVEMSFSESRSWAPTWECKILSLSRV